MDQQHQNSVLHPEDMPHRRAGEQRLEIIANSPLMKVVSYLITTIVMPIVSWALVTLLAEVRQLNDAIAKNNTIVALYDLRISNLEHTSSERSSQLKILNDKMIELDFKISNLQQQKSNGK